MKQTTADKKLESQAQTILRLLKVKKAKCDIYLLSNAEMNALRLKLKERKDFKGREARKISQEKRVNVLSFAEPEGFPHPESGKKTLGEIYINLSFAKGDPGALTRLLIHGILHLTGYTHQRKRDTIEMESKEKLLWHRILSSV